MSDSYFETFSKLFEYIFKNDILEYSVYVTWHSGEEKTMEWKDLETQKTVEKNQKLNEYINKMLNIAISYAEDTGGSYGLKTTVKNNEFGFLIWSGFTTDMINDMDPDGFVDSNVFYSDDFIEKLNSYRMLKSIDKNNFSNFVNFKIEEGGLYYLKLFDQVKNNWIDYEQSEIGEEIETLIFNLFYDHIYSKEEFNIVNDRIIFSDKSVTFCTEEQTILDDKFVSVSSILSYL